MTTTQSATRAEIVIAAVADCFRDDGESMANAIGNVPSIGARLAKATFAPALVITDGEAQLVENILPIGDPDPEKVVSGWNPYRKMFDVVWSGRRHVMMGASQIDQFGNQNFAFIGDPAKPKVQLLGMRGGPGNTIYNKTSYWIPNHTSRVFVEKVEIVSGVGTDRAKALGSAGRFHHLVHIVTNLAVLDFETADGRIRLRSVHPGVTVDDVVANTGFALQIDGDVPESRTPTDEELALIRDVIDPTASREQEVPSA
jgi:acyl CoA:acetate/3-ketoacid CoA transferase beta subunit